MSLGERIRQARERKGLTQADVASHFGIKSAAVTQWEAGTTRPASTRLQPLAKLLGVTVEWLTADEPGPELTTLPPNVRNADHIEPLQRGQLPKDVPVYGTAVGGSDGDFTLNGSRTDYVRRPPGIATVRGVFAIYCQGDSMKPWREQGDLVYIHPSRPARPGDYVLVELKAGKDGQPGKAYLKRLVAVAGGKLRLQQYNPPNDRIEVPAAQVKHVYRVLDWAELLEV